mmetsp:Transcript_6802/g.7867  ORF Transcript_6802/g.7867 Transcript_6802/m.7867 type:complete len:89 (-) Transcript_6802:618-884(-)
MLLILCLNFKKLGKEDMKFKYESMYAGLSLDRRAHLLFPVLFILRRVTFAVISCLFPTQIWLQVVSQFGFVMLVSIFLLSTRVYESVR